MWAERLLYADNRSPFEPERGAVAGWFARLARFPVEPRSRSSPFPTHRDDPRL